LLALATLLAATVAAAPAAAAPASTTLTVTAQSTSVNWGATAVLNGVLQTTEAPARPVDGQQVLVQYAASPTAILWTTAATVTNKAAPYTSGAYTYSWTASRNYYWRMQSVGTSEWASATGAFIYIKVKPVIGKPSCPSSVKHGKKFTVSGSLKPKYPAGSTNVKVKAERYSGGKWKAYKTYTATTADSGSYSKYSVKFSISKKGKFRFYGTTADTSTLSAGKSPYSRSMKVK
jgi:hypothetical protein